ncbi:uncharacterized protein LOC131892690 [Tigriopus californicus]|uniref:uncharacterized protein LOC131892690 n=1 Tax=Tigriopus californicus TaxID=6832 RepID=UPI0027DA6A72|nr:uncharacterized protein LOC131892690 [Tigriopus californicus]
MFTRRLLIDRSLNWLSIVLATLLLLKLQASRENREIDPETKEPYLEHKRLLKKELIQPTESSVSKNEILDHEDVYYDTVEGDYHYFGNGELYDQVAQDNINRRTYHFRRFPFAKRPKTQLAKPVLTYHKPESGQYDSHYQTPQKTPPPWANFLQTVITCLPLSLAAAAVPLGFIDFSGTTSTLTMTPM